MKPPAIVDRADIRPPDHLDRAWFSVGGRVIDDPTKVLAAFGVSGAAQIANHLPRIVNEAIQDAKRGVIQDPAGTAVGGSLAGAGGASGRIYAKFNDLKNVPSMARGAAVFNASAGPGRRVLHSYGFELQGDPGRSGDRAGALLALADTYANALFAFADRAGELGEDGELLNLVPVSASIFAYRFADGRQFKNEHLDPSYSLVAFVIAATHVHDHDVAVPATTMCFYEPDVYARAVQFRDALAAEMKG